jgi:protein AroM
MKKIGMLTIGQSPRDDILPGLKEILGEGYEIVEAGALDDKTLEDVEKIDLDPQDYILVSRMRDGAEIKITKKYIIPMIQEQIHRLEEQGVRLIVIMCTGRFPQFASRGLVVTPSEILKGVLEASLKRGRLGVVYPAKEQMPMAGGEFGREGVEVYAECVSPYEGDDELDQVADRLATQNLDLILLNCFGFSSKVRKVITEKTGVPAIQSNALVARVLKELVSG